MLVHRAEARTAEEKERRKNGGGKSGDLAGLMANATRMKYEFDAKQHGLAAAATTSAILMAGDDNKSHGQQSRRAYHNSLKKIIESSDVILQVLDARDPLGRRGGDTVSSRQMHGPGIKFNDDIHRTCFPQWTSGGYDLPGHGCTDEVVYRIR